MIVALFGCAHPIVISPKTEKIVRDSSSQPKIIANVGYFISENTSKIEITSAGGGGDNVRYFPYKEIEAGYQRMLQNVFDKVTKLKSSNDQSELSKESIKYVFEPVMLTTSGSTGFFTWPPTNFTVDLTSIIRDTSGKTKGNPRVVGNGQVDFILDMDGDYGLAGRLAMEDALLKMQRALLEFKYEDTPTSIVTGNNAQQPKDPPSERLEKLKELLDKGLVTSDEYERKKKEIIDSL